MFAWQSGCSSFRLYNTVSSELQLHLRRERTFQHWTNKFEAFFFWSTVSHLVQHPKVAMILELWQSRAPQHPAMTRNSRGANLFSTNLMVTWITHFHITLSASSRGGFTNDFLVLWFFMLRPWHSRHCAQHRQASQLCSRVNIRVNASRLIVCDTGGLRFPFVCVQKSSTNTLY